MSNSIDLELLPLYRRAGQDQGAVPGLFVARKPRRCARSREADQLILYLAMTGNATVPLDLSEQLVNELVSTYYDTNGSVTAALRVTVEDLNQVLLKRNLQSSGSGQQTIGLLTLITLRGEQIFLAQSGPVYALYLTSGERQELYDVSLSGRGLGISQSAALRYFHASLQPRDVLVISAQPAPGWSVQTLAGLYGQKMGSQQYRLLNNQTDVNAVLVNVKPGTGQITLLPYQPVPSGAVIDSEETTGVPTPPENFVSPAGGAETAEPVLENENHDLVQRQAMLDQYQPLPEYENMQDTALPLSAEGVSVSGTTGSSPPKPVKPVEAAPSTPPEAPRPVRTGPSLTQRIGRVLYIALNRLLPEDAIASIPSSIMAIVAIVVPLVIVVMATAVYFQRGLAAQAEVAYSQAVQAVAQAQVQLEPTGRREGFAAALEYLNAADSYRKLPEAQTLRQQILVELDNLDLARRLNYQPAIIGSLPEGTKVGRLVVADNDIYMLDRQTGNVLRATYTDRGYQLDFTFQCGPGSPANAGPLIDISAWPAGTPPVAPIVGIDANGTLLFCAPDSLPQPKKLPNSPLGELQNLAGFALDLSDVYVLDPASDAVWVYYNGDFNGEPADYFGEQKIPLDDIIDMAANNEELYLLHSDGHMTVCSTGQLGEATPNRCIDPAPYVDMRAGQEGNPLQPIPPYAQIQYSLPPDPSLYLLASSDQAIDRYSLRNLAYQGRYLPLSPLYGEVSASAVDPVQRLAFIAAGNNIYYANMP
jgi:hypothetical protein